MKIQVLNLQLTNRTTKDLFSKILLLLMLTVFTLTAKSQLGIYDFSGSGTCPNQNPAVISQPANATFSNFSSVNTICIPVADQFSSGDWNTSSSIDLTEYNEFSITPATGYFLNLSSITITHYVSDDNSGTTTWVLRSSIDNYASDIISGFAGTSWQSQLINLPAASFSNTGAVMFRLYLISATDNTVLWNIDDIKVNGSVSGIPNDPPNPTSNSPQCSNPGVTISATGTPPTGETWYWQTSASGTSTANSGSTFTVTTSGTYYVRSQDNTTLNWSNGAGSVTVTITPNVDVPVFGLGSSTVRCKKGEIVNYTATANNTTGIVYALDSASVSGGLSINPATGALNFPGGWTGTTIITATAAGCGGPTIATHTVTTYDDVQAPVFALGGNSVICQGAGTVVYSATAVNAYGGIIYSLDAASLAGGNTINSSTGEVTYAAGWSGNTTITATANGCNGPKTKKHDVTITPSVDTPVFILGSSSTRCQAAGSVDYKASANNTTGITYSLDAASLSAGNTINAGSGKVTYVAGWGGSTVITASAAGCNGPKTATHTAITNPLVGAPVFDLGSSSTRCAGASTILYNATAANSTGISYSLDALSVLGGNSINSATGEVTFSALWVGTTTITATATGCGGSKSATHTVSIAGNVGTPSFLMGSTSTRCEGVATITYTATAANTTGITYSLDAASLAGGNTINTSTGAVTYIAGWNGTTTITASAAGCSGPKTANHTVTITPSVANPVFTLGISSTRCQAGGSVAYTATATNSTSITYSLDAASLAGGNTINSTTGIVSYSALWYGTSTITASATGCNGPKTSTHTVTIIPTVGTPAFVSGVTSARCQGAGSVTYDASAPNSTGITYSLDAASLAAGNTINPATGTVNYIAGWSGTSIITASAAGCNGPKTSTHTVTITPTVGTPSFILGTASSRTQGAGTVNYTATASNSTGITYSLDAASLAGGNTINATTGDVTYTAAWNSTTVITASAAGCNGPKTTTHTVTINATTVFKQLYLSDPSQSLDRVDPVNTGDVTTASTALLSTSGTTFTTFTMSPALCDSLVIKAGTITVKTYVTISSGTMPANPNVTALLQYGATTIANITNPVYSGGILTWTTTLPSDITIPAGQTISLRITTAVAGVIFRIDFDSQTKPSKIDLPVSTFIDIKTLDVYSAAYPGGLVVTSGVGGTTKYIRATVTDPFGTSDITGLDVKITPPGTTFAATSVATSGCSRTYQYVWNTPSTAGTYAISAVAKEGYESTVTNTKSISYDICTTCAPVAVNDSATGAGGAPIVIDVLANDYDPNNNINPASLSIVGQPKNGSAYFSNNTIVYLPNGTFQGKDTITYQVCDLTSPTPLCATAQIFFVIDPLIVDICGDASKTHTYYIPYPEDQAYTALKASGSPTIPSNNIRTIISIKIPYPSMTIVWDEWEDGYEANPLNPVQSTTKVWGDGNPFNGVAPGYPSDIIPAGGSIILDNTMNANPRNSASIYYDGKDKIISSGQLALTQVCGEPSLMSVQSIKTNVTSTYDYGQSFTIPLGEDFPSRDFKYTALFIRASQDNTTINIDKDNNGTFETTTTLNQGQSYLVNGGVLTGATVASDKPVGVELNSGGVDNYSIRNAPIFPATWYSHTYYTPVPTSDNAGDNPKDTSAVMFYNSLNRDITINWYSGAPANGSILVPAKSAVRFALAYSTTAAYKFVNPTGESFTAIEIVGSYSPWGGGASGSAYDWSFNLISEERLTDYATVAWAPGGLDLSSPTGPDVNGNPIWVTPTANTTVYVKYDGDISGTSGSVSPCGLRYDVAYTVNALNFIKIKDASDNDQSGIALYTCNGAKIAAVYGEDPQGSTAGSSAYWDVGTTIQPFCKEKLVVATDDYATTLVGQPVTISVINNDFGFLAIIEPSSVSTLGLLQPKHGTVSVNSNGTILYTPDPGFSGVDTFEYNVCSTPSPIVCDVAMVEVKISTCPSNGNQNVISGQIFIDRNKDGNNNDGGAGLAGVKVYLYTDGNCSGSINANELTDSVTVDTSGFYQFTKYPEKTVADDFKDGSGGRTCANGSDGDSQWSSDWSDSGDGSSGFCQSSSNADVEIMKDGAFGYGLRIKDNNVSATRSVNLNGALKAFLTFSYRRKSSSLTSGENIYVQASSNGSSFTTIYTISGDGSTDANYVTIYNQDISSYASTNTAIRFLTNNSVDDGDTVYIGNVSIKYLKYPQCYITSVAAPSIPSGYSMTTVSQKNMTISAGGTCTSQFDFGLTKVSMTISGTLRNDKNGLTDGTVNGPAVGSPDGTGVYAYLADPWGKVAFKTLVNSSTGTYSFPMAEINSNYTLLLSTINVALGATVPSSSGFSSTWVAVGDAFGTNNGAGTGSESGTPDLAIAVKTASSNVINVDFGIQRLPNSDNHIRSINQPTVNQVITLDGQGMNPPVLSGTDPEDCSGGCVLTARAAVIDTVPHNAELYYNGALVTNGLFISSFNPALLQLRITAAAAGDTNITFQYSYVDAALMKDPTPATYKLVWLIPLPASGLVATANLNGSEAMIKWSTLSEQNTSHYIVERSVDNVNFTTTGGTISAAGNSSVKSYYQMADDVSGLLQYSMIYYRVKLVDIDGKEKYSNVVVVRISAKPEITSWPNPFRSSITININTERATTYNIRLTDMNGRAVKRFSKSVSRGVSQINLPDLDNLTRGVYLLEISDENMENRTVQKFLKE